MTASLLIARLRTNGVSLRSDRTRLIVVAPRGVITPELREQMACLKLEILSELEAEAFAHTADSATMAAIYEIAVLLTTAYARYTEARPARRSGTSDSGDRELANSVRESVHGVVP